MKRLAFLIQLFWHKLVFNLHISNKWCQRYNFNVLFVARFNLFLYEHTCLTQSVKMQTLVYIVLFRDFCRCGAEFLLNWRGDLGFVTSVFAVLFVLRNFAIQEREL